MDVHDRYHHGALRQALIDLAIETIERDGLDNLSLRGIAEAAGVSKNAPYRHFAGKHELLTTVAAEGFRRLADRLEAAERESGDRDSWQLAMERLSIAYVDFAVANPAMYRLMFSKYGYTLESEECRLNSARAFSVLVRCVTARMAQGWRAGEDETSAVLSVWALVHGWAGLLIDDLVPRELGSMSERWRQMIREFLS